MATGTCRTASGRMRVAIRLSEELRIAIRRHASTEYPYECCGAMLGNVEDEVKVVTQLKPVPNEHEEGHERRYLISANDMFQIERFARDNALSVVGFYHSHPDHPARPSG